MFFLFEKHKFTFMTPVKGLTADIKSFKEGVNVLEFPLFFSSLLFSNRPLPILEHQTNGNRLQGPDAYKSSKVIQI